MLFGTITQIYMKNIHIYLPDYTSLFMYNILVISDELSVFCFQL